MGWKNPDREPLGDRPPQGHAGQAAGQPSQSQPAGPTYGAGQWVEAMPADGRVLQWRLSGNGGIDLQTVWPNGTVSGWQDFYVMGAGPLPDGADPSWMYSTYTPAAAPGGGSTIVILYAQGDERLYRTLQLNQNDVWTPWGDITEHLAAAAPITDSRWIRSREPASEGAQPPGDRTYIDVPDGVVTMTEGRSYPRGDGEDTP